MNQRRILSMQVSEEIKVQEKVDRFLVELRWLFDVESTGAPPCRLSNREHSPLLVESSVSGCFSSCDALSLLPGDSISRCRP